MGVVVPNLIARSLDQALDAPNSHRLNSSVEPDPPDLSSRNEAPPRVANRRCGGVISAIWMTPLTLPAGRWPPVVRCRSDWGRTRSTEVISGGGTRTQRQPLGAGVFPRAGQGRARSPLGIEFLLDPSAGQSTPGAQHVTTGSVARVPAAADRRRIRSHNSLRESKHATSAAPEDHTLEQAHDSLSRRLDHLVCPYNSSAAALTSRRPSHSSRCASSITTSKE